MDRRTLVGEGEGDQCPDKNDDQAREGGDIVPNKEGSGAETSVRGGETTLEVLNNYQDQERRPSEGERSEIGLVEVGEEPDDDFIIVCKLGLGQMEVEDVLKLCSGGGGKGGGGEGGGWEASWSDAVT